MSLGTVLIVRYSISVCLSGDIGVTSFNAITGQPCSFCLKLLAYITSISNFQKRGNKRHLSLEFLQELNEVQNIFQIKSSVL